MPSSKVSGIAVAEIIAGVVFFWSGFKGQSLKTTLTGLLKGQPPASSGEAPPSVGITSSSGQGSIKLPGSTVPSPGGGDTAPAPGDTGAASQSAAQNQGTAKLSVIISHPSWGSGTEWADWVSLWNQESGWNNLAQNTSSGAFGIAQALGHGTSGTGGKYGNEYGANYGLSTAQAIAANNGDALYQIQWGINYIAQTYGSPSAAWAHEKAFNWY